MISEKKEHISVSEFIDKIQQQLQSENVEVSKTVVGQVIESSIELIKSLVKSGVEVRIKGFGTYKKGKISAKTGINPLTKQPINLPERAKLSFKMSHILKESFNA